MPKKRNHKKVIQKRKIRQGEQQRKNQEQVFEKLCKQYSEDNDSIPAPNLVEALARHNIPQDEHFSLIFQKLAISATNY